MFYNFLKIIFTKKVMREIYRRALLKLTNTKLWYWLLMKVIPYIRFTTYYTSFRGWKYKRGYAKLEPGHILLCIDKNKLTTKLIGGEFTHAALCVGKGEDSEYEIAEMTHSDFTRSQFYDIARESTRVIIGKCNKWDAKYIKEVIKKCKSFSDAKYDVHFKMGVKQLACSELVFHADFEHRLEAKLDDVAGLGIEYISPTGLFKSPHFEIVWDSDDEELSSATPLDKAL